jgi:hypothetical protein
MATPTPNPLQLIREQPMLAKYGKKKSGRSELSTKQRTKSGPLIKSTFAAAVDRRNSQSDFPRDI